MGMDQYLVITFVQFEVTVIAIYFTILLPE